MSTRKKPKKNIIQRLFKRSWQLLDRITKAIVNGVLRSLMVSKRRSRRSQAGFVLPTVVMVVLVVALLTTAIVIRSFDRAKNASNYRVNEAVLNAATPAIDRAKAKLEYLFTKDTNLQGDTPPDPNIASVLDDETYTLGDETPLRLAYNLTNPVSVGSQQEPSQQLLDTAWKFPVDTDNNGRFDSFTLYGIYFKNPPVDGSGAQLRARTPLESRTLPQEDGQTGGRCPSAAGGAAGWTKMSNGKLKKAFFTYVATVPIAQTQYAALQTTGYKNITAANAATQFEAYTGNRGFSALELQLDQARIALDNNAVWFEDDLMINATPTLRLNGRVHTNSNLMVSNPSGDQFINFLQVSSPGSCFYEPENAKIIVGGHIVAGGPGAQTAGGASVPNQNFTNSQVTVDMYDEDDPLNPPAGWDITDAGANRRLVLNSNSNTVTGLNPLQVLSNNTAYAKRLDVLVQGARNLFYNGRAAGYTPTVADVKGFTQFPQEIGDSFEAKYSDASSAPKLLEKVIETYFKERLRRVSYAEVPANSVDNLAVFNPPAAPTATTGTVLVSNVTPTGTGEQFVFSGGGVIAPPLQWMAIDEAGTNTYLPINTAQLPASRDPRTSTEKDEERLGDRIQVGNRLPYRWPKPGTSPLEYAEDTEGQAATGTFANGAARVRYGLAKPLDDIGDTSRNGYWEQAAAKLPGSRFKDTAQGIDEELAGGLRIITGAGIYVDGETTVGGAGTGRRIRRVQESPTQPAEINPDDRYINLTGQSFNEIKTFLPEPPKPTELVSKYQIPIPDLASIPNRLQNASGLPTATADDYFIVVWPDTMPMYRFNPRDSWDFNNDGLPNIGEGLKGDLQMRATVVYHYASTNPDQPIACISSYYDPTNEDTAANDTLWTNNGKNYPVPTTRTVTARLRRQARMIFPDGRWVNEPLVRAIEKFDLSGAGAWNLADKAAIDAANCALGILDNPAGAGSSPVPNGAIKEAAFLDARQVKALHKPTGQDSLGNSITPETLLTDITDPKEMQIGQLKSVAGVLQPSSNQYTLPIEQRQPLEVRVTEIDLDVLRQQTIGTPTNTSNTEANDQEYLLPNSGIIYASRDDALLDISDPTDQQGRGPSATDFRLDPTRRPNGIRLINGENLSREDFYRTAEKGLILASDVPVYIQGDFNLHLSGGTRVEEFTNTLDMPNTGVDPGDFYERQETQRDTRFACRTGAPGGTCTGDGDQWRAARILADAVTLLSADFTDGYRNEGDYNLNNNAGNTAVEARLKNGFWWNDFATTANWFNATGRPSDKTSYITNNVTPIQRRVQFPQYLMEACPSQPVSDCGPQDWVYSYTRALSPNNGPITTQKASDFIGITLPPNTVDQAGTTATVPISPTGIFSSAARRVAFKRNAFGALVLPGTCNATTAATDCDAIPIGVNGTTAVEVKYAGDPAVTPTPTAADTIPTAVDNALWYATTGDAANADPSAAPTYDGATNLYYRLDNDAETVSDKQVLLPGTPEFPDTNPATLNIPSLNGLTATDPSDYAVCTAGQTSLSYEVGTPAGTPCSATNLTAIDATARALAAVARLTPPGAGTPESKVYSIDNTSLPAATTPASPPGVFVLRATAPINFFNLPTIAAGDPNRGIVPGGAIVLDRGNQTNPIFVIVSPPGSALSFRQGEPVTVSLNGVEPNNVFWVAEAGMNIGGDNTLVGNFLGFVLPGLNVNIYSSGTTLFGRVLGFDQMANISGGAMTITAMTTTDQPLLAPVLQLHSYTGDTTNPFPVGFPPSADALNWFPIAQPTTVNAVLVMGDSPSRPLSTNDAEFGGGLQNFPRFIEIWQGSTNTISGGLIQLKKSTFATAPFESIDDGSRDVSLFFDTPAYTVNEGAGRQDYRYKIGAVINKAPYYLAPTRQWGYDVGLLSQTPDLFSSQFTQPSAGEPNEFYREVGRDDTWVKTLLCAAEPVTGSTTYQYALSDQERPSSCPPVTDYSSSTTPSS
jgi:type II secretory pathway pseudopilin PulG